MISSRKTLLNATHLQPKFKDIVCESEPSIVQYLRWVGTFGGIVGNLMDGDFLERFLDIYLGREQRLSATRPDFLNDHELAVPDDEDVPPPDDSETLRSEARSTEQMSARRDSGRA